MVECGTGRRFVADLFHDHSQRNWRGLALLSFPSHSTRETRVARFAQATAAAADGGCEIIVHGFFLFLCFVSFPFVTDLLSFIYLWLVFLANKLMAGGLANRGCGLAVEWIRAVIGSTELVAQWFWLLLSSVGSCGVALAAASRHCEQYGSVGTAVLSSSRHVGGIVISALALVGPRRLSGAIGKPARW